MFDGFADYLTSHSSYIPGVYSSPGVWQAIFGSGSAATVPINVYEWTYEPKTTDVSLAPTGWCLKGTTTCAQFFGGVTSSSPQALMWQWSGGGGLSNGIGDFDRIDTNNIGCAPSAPAPRPPRRTRPDHPRTAGRPRRRVLGNRVGVFAR